MGAMLPIAAAQPGNRALRRGRSHSMVRNILIIFGISWLSRWISWALSVGPIGGINEGILYSDSIFSAIMMGVMTSLGRTLASILAGILVTLAVVDGNAELWGLFLAALLVADAPVRYHWGYPATGWDRLWQGVSLIFPGFACTVAAVITARLRKNEDRP